jgi:DNA-binding IscR family transcriptional regulator
MTQCTGSEEASDCALDAHCKVKPHMNVVSNAVRGALGAVSLQSLASTQ